MVNYGNKVSGNFTVTGNEQVGAATDLGDNGAGELKLANATTVPTTNPVGGALLYATGGGLFYRDPAGNVWGVPTPASTGGFSSVSLAESINYSQVNNSVATDTGTLTLASVFLTAGESIGHLGMVSSTTPASGPTHWWLAVLDNTYKLQGHTADQLTGAIAANTWFNIAMAAPFVPTYTGRYYLGVMIATSVTQPTLCSGPVPVAAMITGAGAPTPLLAGKSTTGLTTPGTDGTTVYAAPSSASNTPFLYVAP